MHHKNNRYIVHKTDPWNNSEWYVWYILLRTVHVCFFGGCIGADFDMIGIDAPVVGFNHVCQPLVQPLQNNLYISHQNTFICNCSVRGVSSSGCCWLSRAAAVHCNEIFFFFVAVRGQSRCHLPHNCLSGAGNNCICTGCSKVQR